MRRTTMSLKTRCIMEVDDYFDHYAGGLRHGSCGNHVFLDRGAEVLGVAHLDFIGANHFAVAQLGHLGNVVFSPSLDDRLGVHMLLDVLPEFGMQFDVLLTDGEESAMSTAQDFETDKKYRWMFSFDRRGGDAVMYQYATVETRRAVQEAGFRIGHGTYSDIGSLGHLGCAGFNFGIGYQNEHTRICHAVLDEVYAQIGKFAEFWAKNEKGDFRGEYRQSYYYGSYGSYRSQGHAGREGYARYSGENWWEKKNQEINAAATDTSFPLAKSNRSAAEVARRVSEAARKIPHELECGWCGTSNARSQIGYYGNAVLCKRCIAAVKEQQAKREQKST